MIRTGLEATVETVVTHHKTAVAVGSGSLPVFATPMMIAEMERAACAALAGELPPEETTVGTQINVSHLSATPIGKTVRTSAVVTNVDGRKIEFTVSSYDESGEIGTGTHTRFLVGATRFLEKANQK